MEQHFGYNFSNVRVHAEDRVGESTRAVNAVAYTVGHHIAFQPGYYDPYSLTGQKLIAHELAHVTQQRNATHGQLTIGDANSSAEVEADRAADSALHGRAVTPARGNAAVLNRQVESGSTTKPSPAIQPDPKILAALLAQCNLGQLDPKTCLQFRALSMGQRPLPDVSKKNEAGANAEMQRMREEIRKFHLPPNWPPPPPPRLPPAPAPPPPSPAPSEIKQMIDAAIKSMGQKAVEKGVKKIDESVRGKSMAQGQTSPLGFKEKKVEDADIYFSGPEIPWDIGAKEAPHLSFHYWDGIRNSYLPEEAVRFTLEIPDHLVNVQNKRLVVVNVEEANEPRPKVVYTTKTLANSASQDIDMVAPEKNGKYVIRVEVAGLPPSIEEGSIREFEVIGPTK
jgi:hypothetical protein